MADKVVTEFIARDRGMEAALRDVRKEIRDLSNESNRNLDALNRRFTSMGRLVKGLFIGGAVGTGISWAVKLAADMEQTEVAFTTLLGSGQKAQNLLDSLQKAAAQTPFQLDQYADAAKKLAAFGAEAEEIPETLRRIGDVSAGIGQNIGEIAEIYGKARVQGRLFMEDINQLTGRGIPIIGALAKQFGRAESEVRELVSSGQVGFKHLEQAFKDLTSEGGQFFGMMEEQSKTLAGMWSTFKDNVAALARELGTALLPQLKDILSILTAMVGEWNAGAEKAEDMKGTIDAANQSVFDLAMAFASIADVLRDATIALQMVVAQFKSINLDSLSEEDRQRLKDAGVMFSGRWAVKEAGFYTGVEVNGKQVRNVSADEIASILQGSPQGFFARAGSKTFVERLQTLRDEQKAKNNKKTQEPGDQENAPAEPLAKPFTINDLIGLIPSPNAIGRSGVGSAIVGPLTAGSRAGSAAAGFLGGLKESEVRSQRLAEWIEKTFSEVTQNLRMRWAMLPTSGDEGTRQVHFEALTALSRRIQAAAASQSPELQQQKKIEEAVKLVTGKLNDAIGKATRGEFNKDIVEAVKDLGEFVGFRFS